MIEIRLIRYYHKSIKTEKKMININFVFKNIFHMLKIDIKKIFLY